MANGNRTRKTVTFEPSGPILTMINSEVRGRAHGAKSRLLELAVAKFIGPKYPKQLSEFNQLYRYE